MGKDQFVRWRDCKRKVRYEDETDAEKALERMVLDPRIHMSTENMKTLHVYPCWHCLGFHIGNEKGTRRSQLTQKKWQQEKKK
jgi:hypothetical protein